MDRVINDPYVARQPHGTFQRDDTTVDCRGEGVPFRHEEGIGEGGVDGETDVVVAAMEDPQDAAATDDPDQPARVIDDGKAVHASRHHPGGGHANEVVRVDRAHWNGHEIPGAQPPRLRRPRVLLLTERPVRRPAEERAVRLLGDDVGLRYDAHRSSVAVDYR